MAQTLTSAHPQRKLPLGQRLEQRPALGKFFSAYEEHVNQEFSDKLSGETTTLRKSLRRQAERLAGHLTRGESYTPLHITW
jgi:hypothetical protein